MSHLSKEQIAELTAELERVLSKLERSMRSTEEALRPVQLDQSAVGRLSRIDSLQNQGLTRKLREREQARLAQLTAAFQRMEAGTYGLCEECGGDILFERLQVFPETTVCGACGG